jgi:hypothetical protein
MFADRAVEAQAKAKKYEVALFSMSVRELSS